MTRWYEVLKVVGTVRYFGSSGEIVEARRARLASGPRFRSLEEAWAYIDRQTSGRYVVRTPSGSLLPGD